MSYFFNLRYFYNQLIFIFNGTVRWIRKRSERRDPDLDSSAL
jgi:hypothetical protein